ncbi:MAG TPA: 30S ribosomal protein S3 [Patescibacteria group bacterium]|nr:30S ribosomal protein S3 [Patescibacteria group bacterium]
MGSKVNPRAFRTNTTFQYPSRWFASKQDFAKNLQKDVQIRQLIRKKFRDGGVARIEIERALGDLVVIIHTSKPGVVIGRGGAFIDELKKRMKKEFFGSEKIKITITIQEVPEADLNSELVYQNIRDQIEQRVPFRRAMKRAIGQVMRAGAKGSKVRVSGRLNGSDIARTETLTQGRLPLQTLRANIDYSRGVAYTVYGIIGIKVWIYKGEVFSEEDLQETKKKKQYVPHSKRKQLHTGGERLILRKRVDVQKEKEVQSINPGTVSEKKKQPENN